MDVLDTSRRLGAGDRLSYRVVEERREPIALVVADSGELEVPLIGRLSAAGRTCKELAQAIKPMLEREYFFKATVIVGLDAVSAKARGHVYIERAGAAAGRAGDSARRAFYAQQGDPQGRRVCGFRQ